MVDRKQMSYDIEYKAQDGTEWIVFYELDGLQPMINGVENLETGTDIPVPDWYPEHDRICEHIANQWRDLEPPDMDGDR